MVQGSYNEIPYRGFCRESSSGVSTGNPLLRIIRSQNETLKEKAALILATSVILHRWFTAPDEEDRNDRAAFFKKPVKYVTGTLAVQMTQLPEFARTLLAPPAATANPKAWPREQLNKQAAVVQPPAEPPKMKKPRHTRLAK